MKNLVFGAIVGLVLPLATNAQTIDLTIGTDQTLDPIYRDGLIQTLVDQSNNKIAQSGSSESIKWNQQFDGSYFGFRYSVGAVETGLVDVAIGSSFWDHVRFPLQNVSYSAAFATGDLGELVAAMNEIHAEYPKLNDAWSTVDAVFLTAIGVPNYHLATNFPLSNVDDLMGRRILAPGPLANWVRALGAVPVNGVESTYHGQLVAGQADGAILPLSVYVSHEIHEPAPHLMLVGFGAQIDRALIMGSDTWARLSPGAQSAFVDLAVEFSTQTTRKVMANEAAHMARLAELDVEINALGEQERSDWANKVMAGFPAVEDEQVQADFDEIRAVLLAKLRERGQTPLFDQ